MKKQKMLAQAITLGLLLAVPLGASAENLYIDENTNLSKNDGTWKDWDAWHGLVNDKRHPSEIYYQNSAAGNTITISGNNLSYKREDGDISFVDVYGGYATNQDATVAYNTIRIMNGSGGNKIYGGYSTSTGDVIHNEVYIEGGTYTPENNTLDIRGGSANLGASNYNSVIIKNATVYASYIYGGQSSGKGSNGNTVKLDNVTSTNDQVWIVGGRMTEDGNVENNEVIINDGKVYSRYIYGGWTRGNGVVKKNRVVLSGNGEVSGTVAGGCGSNSSSVVSDNTVFVTGQVKLSGADLYGYRNGDPTKSKGNSLVIDGWTGEVNSVQNFDTLTFENLDLSKGDVLTIINNNGLSMDSLNVDVKLKAGQATKVGDAVTLVSDADIDFSAYGENGKKDGQYRQGTALDVAGTISGTDGTAAGTNGELTFRVNSVKANKQTAIVTNANAAASAFLNNGGDLAADSLADLGAGYGTETFAAVYGSDSKYDDIDIDGWNTIVGVGNNSKTKAGDFAWGVFYEGGSGDYDVLQGEGSTRYNGGGAAARLTRENGVYGELSVRAGKVKNELQDVLVDTENISYGYKTESDYLGFHVGVGKIIALDNGGSVDAYAKYFHSKVDGDSFTLTNGETYDVDSFNSDRVRLGARYNQSPERKFNLYYGAAWEYEFNGESDGKASGYAIETGSLKGSTVIGELGVSYKASDNWFLDATVKGYGGQREGFSGKVQVNYLF